MLPRRSLRAVVLLGCYIGVGGVILGEGGVILGVGGVILGAGGVILEHKKVGCCKKPISSYKAAPVYTQPFSVIYLSSRFLKLSTVLALITSFGSLFHSSTTLLPNQCFPISFLNRNLGKCYVGGKRCYVQDNKCYAERKNVILKICVILG